MATCNRHTHSVAQWANQIPNKSIILDLGTLLERFSMITLPLFNTCFRTFQEERDKQCGSEDVSSGVRCTVLGTQVRPTSSFCQLTRTLQPDSRDVQVERGSRNRSRSRGVAGGAQRLHAKITPEFIVKATI